MPVGFVDADRAAGYAAFAGVPSPEEFARFFVLDAADVELVGRRRVGLRLQRIDLSGSNDSGLIDELKSSTSKCVTSVRSAASRSTGLDRAMDSL